MKETFKKGRPDLTLRLIHLGIMIFALSAWLTGEWGEDYKKGAHLGFTLHKWLGMGLTLPLVLRLLYGMIGPADLRFSRWVPWTGERLQHAWRGVKGVLLLNPPDRTAHLGMAGIIQAAGIALFAWMAATGSILFLFLEPGRRASGPLRGVMELHEAGEGLIPAYLIVHVGAVTIHALFGRQIWRKMLFLDTAGRG